jgi:GNAT superfamily N-acetyltransferase
LALTVLSLDPAHLDACAGLVAARHKRDRARQPYLPEAFESAERVRPLIEEALSAREARAVVAVRDGQVVGFLVGSTLNFPVDSVPAQFTPARGLSMGYALHAVASEADAPVYRPMYAALSEPYVRSGYFDHALFLPASDSAALDVWASLGFGRATVAAMRAVEALIEPTVEVDIRRASVEDMDAIDVLDRTLERHHARPPTYLPYRWEAAPALREFAAGGLRNPANAWFLAYRNGLPVGMNSLLTEGFMNPLLRPDSSIYLYQGIVEADWRGTGVGKALLANSLRWANEQGYRWCGLHYFSANYTAADFWLGHGFEPAEIRLSRTIDQRVNWQEPGHQV